MIRIKTWGVAFAAMLALSAFAASAASAEGLYTASSYSATGTGTSPVGNDTFTTEAGNVECKSHFEGTLAKEASTSLTVKATYSECKAFGFATATVKMNSCDYLFTTPTTVTPPHVWTAKVHVKCTEPSKPITITAGNCEVTVGEQSPEGHIIITDTTTVPRDVDVQATVTGIHYTVIKDGFLCPFKPNVEGEPVPYTKTGASYNQHEEITFKSTTPGQGIHVGHVL
jgi:hypothetical protein